VSTRLELADAPALARATRRTRATRLVLALALAGLVGAAALTAAKGGTAGSALKALQREARGGTVGLVLFSDTGEETLPPGSSPSELDPFIRYFSDPTKPTRNPWSNGFSAGTAISKGVSAARQALLRDHVGGRVVIVSDLGDAFNDLSALRKALRALKSLPGVRIQVFPLPVTDTRGLLLVRGILGRSAISRAAPQQPRFESARSAAFPLTRVTLAGLAALAIAANELLAVSLRWRTA